MSTLLVLAAAGLRVPREGNSRLYITDTPPAGAVGHEVQDSAYTLRCLASGDLVRVFPAAPAPAAEPVAEPVAEPDAVPAVATEAEAAAATEGASA